MGLRPRLPPQAQPRGPRPDAAHLARVHLAAQRARRRSQGRRVPARGRPARQGAPEAHLDQHDHRQRARLDRLHGSLQVDHGRGGHERGTARQRPARTRVPVDALLRKSQRLVAHGGAARLVRSRGTRPRPLPDRGRVGGRDASRRRAEGRRPAPVGGERLPQADGGGRGGPRRRRHLVRSQPAHADRGPGQGPARPGRRELQVREVPPLLPPGLRIRERWTRPSWTSCEDGFRPPAPRVAFGTGGARAVLARTVRRRR